MKSRTSGAEDGEVEDHYYFAQPAPVQPSALQPPPGAPPGWAPPREAAVVQAAAPPSSASAALPLLLVLAGAVLAVSAFLPWVKAFVVGISGIELGEVDLFPAGRVVLGLGFVVALAGVKELIGRGSAGTRAGAAVAGLGAVVVGLRTRSQISDKVDQAVAYGGIDVTGLEDVLPHAGAGLWAAVVAGAVAAACGVGMLLRR